MRLALSEAKQAHTRDRTALNMVDRLKTDDDLSFRNVELHSLGRKEYGTLVLTRHHFVFRYYPDAKRTHVLASRQQNGSASPRQPGSISTESSTIVEGAPSPSRAEASGYVSESRSTGQESSQDGTGRDQSSATPRQRQKEMWMPYPLVHHCSLRPSHSILQASAHETEVSHVDEEETDDEKELFPPTYGTASYTARPSTDSARLAPYSSPVRAHSPAAASTGADAPVFSETGRPPAIRIRLKDFRMMALHFHGNSAVKTSDDSAREVFFALRSRCCVDNVKDLHAFHFSPPKEETATSPAVYDARREYARMGIGGKVASGAGAAWRITDINKDYSYSATYPSVLCVPATVSDNLLKYGGVFRSRSRVPCLSYLHSNGGSITRSSQPMVGVQNKRNPQDERLVSAIFSSHTPAVHASGGGDQQQEAVSRASSELTSVENDSTALPTSQSDTALNEGSDEKATPLQQKVYGSTRRNLIVDARPKINALANRATGGGIEDVAHYRGSSDMAVEKVFLNVANIHVMRASLDKVVESFANSDYIKMKPDQEALRKSGWLGHIAGLLDGSEMVARVVGLGGSHVLVHCSDGWDRTAQISALAQIMLDPHTRTFDGFVTLIQKDFLSFGHKFRDRDGVEGSEKWFEIENERVAPSRNRENNHSDPNTLNALGAKAFTGAKNWFGKNRGAIFGQQNNSRDNVAGDSSPLRSGSPPPSLPPNPFVHSPPSSTGKEDKPYRMSEKEVSPVFHQFLDTVYQLLHHRPDAFEFNEHFLCRLFYHVYSCQYGEFLFNTERERVQCPRATGSVWSHFLSRRQEFINPDFNARLDDPLLFPTRSGYDREVDVRWWHRLFRRDDDEMNLARHYRSNNIDAGASGSSNEHDVAATATTPASNVIPPPPGANGSMRQSKSTPQLPLAEGSLATDMSTMSLSQHEAARTPTKPASAVARETPSDDSSAHVQSDKERAAPAEAVKLQQPVAVEYEGDPLGVSASAPKETKRGGGGGLDFAAFASQNAFQDRR